MKILVTGGNTFVPIDRVRGITNVFTGRTGTQIALSCRDRGHSVTLLTSHPELVGAGGDRRLRVLPYRTFDDLAGLLEAGIVEESADAVIHCAAVSDYRAAGIFAPAAGTFFEPETGRWHSREGAPPALADRTALKVKSDEPELWLRLVRTPKLIDRIRGDWHFRGILVKFKLEVGIGDEELLARAEASRCQSQADLMVANTLEAATAWAFLGPLEGRYEHVERGKLAARLVEVLETLHGEHGRG